MKPAAATEPGTFTGKHMALLAFGFFGVIIAVNVGMAVVSSVSWTGLVVENSYVASQEFEEKRMAHESQVTAGWQSAFTFASGTAQLAIRDATGAAPDLGEVTMLVNRPVGGHDDQTLPLVRGADGTYSTALTLADGVWDVWITAPKSAKGFYELHERFKVGETVK